MNIYAIPGLGTTEKLFDNIKITGVEFIALKWPETSMGDTMQSYAEKFLLQIDRSSPFCLLGVSFGGMLCVELSTILVPKKTFLISSCKTRKELSWYLRIFKYIPLHKLMCDKLHRYVAYEAKWILGFGSSFVPEYLEMVNSMAKDYFKHCLNMIVNWERKEFPKSVIHIHGNADKLLLFKNIKADYSINKGSHAMVVFNGEEISQILEKELSSFLQ